MRRKASNALGNKSKDEFLLDEPLIRIVYREDRWLWVVCSISRAAEWILLISLCVLSFPCLFAYFYIFLRLKLEPISHFP